MARPYGDERMEQEERLFITTRGKQYFLRGATEDRDEYCVVSNIVSDGYDFFYGVALSDWVREHLYDHSVTGVEFVEGMGLETVTIPHRTYVVFETKDQKTGYQQLFRAARSAWIYPDRMAARHGLPARRRARVVYIPLGATP